MSWHPKPRNSGGRQVYPTASKVHRRQPVADARPDSAQKTGCQGHRFPIHRCTVGLDVTSTAVENRFTPQLVGFLRAVLATVLRALAASPQTVDLLTSSRAFALATAVPSHCPTNWPTSSPAVAASARGSAMRSTCCVTSSPALSSNCNHPLVRRDATNPIAQEVAPPSLRCSTWLLLSGSVPEPHARRCFLYLSAAACTSVFTPWPALALLQYLRQQTVGTDRRVRPAGVSHRLPSMIALRVPQEVATGGDRKPTRSPKHAAAVAEYLEWQTDIFVTNCEPELLTCEAVVLLYLAGRSNLCSNSSHQPAPTHPPARRREQFA